MSYKVEFSKKFQKTIAQMDKQTSKQIKQTIDKFLVNPYTSDWIKLKGFTNYYRIRCGNYRIIFEKIDSDIKLIKFLTVQHRRDVYKDLL